MGDSPLTRGEDDPRAIDVEVDDSTVSERSDRVDRPSRATGTIARVHAGITRRVVAPIAGRGVSAGVPASHVAPCVETRDVLLRVPRVSPRGVREGGVSAAVARGRVLPRCEGPTDEAIEDVAARAAPHDPRGDPRE